MCRSIKDTKSYVVDSMQHPRSARRHHHRHMSRKAQSSRCVNHQTWGASPKTSTGPQEAPFPRKPLRSSSLKRRLQEDSDDRTPLPPDLVSRTKEFLPKNKTVWGGGCRNSIVTPSRRKQDPQVRPSLAPKKRGTNFFRSLTTTPPAIGQSNYGKPLRGAWRPHPLLQNTSSLEFILAGPAKTDNKSNISTGSRAPNSSLLVPQNKPARIICIPAGSRTRIGRNISLLV